MNYQQSGRRPPRPQPVPRHNFEETPTDRFVTQPWNRNLYL
jgi:hypothetical protein